MSTRTMAETLRAVADLIDGHPDLPLPPYVAVYDHTPHTANLKWYLHINGKGDAAEQKELAAKIIKALGGKWNKNFERQADFTQQRDGLDLQVTVVREAVCERIVTGTETVTVPAIEAQPERTEEREIIEWRCEPLLAEAVAS